MSRTHDIPTTGEVTQIISRCKNLAVFGMTRGDSTINVCETHLRVLIHGMSPLAALVYWLQVSKPCDYRYLEI